MHYLHMRASCRVGKAACHWKCEQEQGNEDGFESRLYLRGPRATNLWGPMMGLSGGEARLRCMAEAMIKDGQHHFPQKSASSVPRDENLIRRGACTIKG